MINELMIHWSIGYSLVMTWHHVMSFHVVNVLKTAILDCILARSFKN